MNYVKLAEQIAHKFCVGSDAERFRFGVSLLQDNPYGWGAESLFTQDCSGSVAFGLLCAGYNVRMTADDYYRLLFTIAPADTFDPGEIYAIFYTADTSRRHVDRVVLAGTVTHVTPVIGEDVVLDAVWGHPARVRTRTRAEALHRQYRTTPVLRALDWARAGTLDKSGRYPVDDPDTLAIA